MDNIEIERTDLGSLMGILANRIRTTGLAVSGVAHRHSERGAAEYRELMGVVESLEGIARVVQALEDRLCGECRLREVVEQVSFGKGRRA